MIQLLFMIIIIGLFVVFYFVSSLVVSLIDKLFNDKKGGEGK